MVEHEHHQQHHHHHHGHDGAAEAATDPVCGMNVDPAKAAGEFAYKGTKYYFCSKHCLHSFRIANGETHAA